MVVRGHALDRQQMEAVMDDSPTQLVIAGAGTGKTTTLIGKVRHLVEDLGVDPGSILMISLTNNTVADLRRAVGEEFGPGFGSDIMTIHALGNRILRRKGCVGRVRTELLAGIIYDLVESDRRCARAFMQYVESMRQSGASDLSYGGLPIRGRGLRCIADVLFECGIRCEYIRPSHGTDSVIPAHLRVEHGGVAFTIRADDEDARAASKDRRSVMDMLRRHGIEAEAMNVNDLAAGILEAWGTRVPDQVGTFISRCKSTGTNMRQLDEANRRNPTALRADVSEMLFLLDRVWDHYNMVCLERDMADYEDMVIQAAESVRAGRSPGKRYSWVLVDEYQDVSSILVDLLMVLRSATGFRLFCVGDDWQSIYSFTGGDVWQMYDFGKVWGGYGRVSVRRIERTYRYPQQIADMASRFISKNPMQQKKHVVSMGADPTIPVQLLPVASDRDIPRMISNRLDYLDPSGSVMVVGRTRNDVYALGGGTGQFLFGSRDGPSSGTVDVTYRRWSEDSGGWEDVRPLRFMTAHSSKGLEADFVFLLADRDRGGFPSLASDSIGDLFRRREEGIELPEERRVLYVAMTRARKRLFIVNRMDEDGYAQSGTSPFVQEIIADNPMLSKSTPFCPECFGPMRISAANGRRFYGCCDYPACRGTRPFFGL